MSLINAGFRMSFCLSLTSLFALILLTACQPLIQAQTGAQTKNPVISPNEDKATTLAEQNQPIAPVSTALTAEDIAAAPINTDTKYGKLIIQNTFKGNLEYPLYAKESIKKAGVFKKISSALSFFIFGGYAE